jgi:hypothetical protein
VSAAKLDIDPFYLTHHYPYLKTENSNFSKMEEEGRIALSFYFTDHSNGSSIDYKTRVFNECMKFMKVKRKESLEELRIGALCGYFGECSNNLKNYFSRLYINRSATPPEYYLQSKLLGKLVRHVTLDKIRRGIGGIECIKNNSEIDLTYFDERLEKGKMIKLLKIASKLAVPMDDIIVDKEIDARYNLKERYQKIMKKNNRNILKEGISEQETFQ